MIIGSSPETCAAQASRSCCAMIGPQMPTAVSDVIAELPRLRKRRLRRRLKKRSQVRTSSEVVLALVGAEVEELCRMRREHVGALWVGVCLRAVMHGCGRDACILNEVLEDDRAVVLRGDRVALEMNMRGVWVATVLV